MRHPSLSRIVWQDLCQQSPLEVAYNLILPFPFFLFSWWCAHQGWWLPALVGSFLFFTAALRQAHDAYHNTLGVGRVLNNLMLYVLSSTMLCSTHAIRKTHLNHHRDPLGASDVEGNWARLPWYQAIIGGGIFSLRIQWYGLTHGSRRTRLQVALDMLITISIFASALLWSPTVLVYHVLVMLLANTLVGFFAVWSVHHDCDEEVYARSERRLLANLFTFNLLYHMEHHLFPAVSTQHLPQLAKRIEVTAPDWLAQPVLPVPAALLSLSSGTKKPLK
ncbi:fatty acid desaturase family protein [Psychrobacter aestuarii]|uniref:Fatty acid desaturase domain-containing protein n=1 Tax=Psychrobacter aestuarii TaxID=556327 RepID=A0ABN0W3X1_9GAMM|nr:fatty acid desaturase [Psychrobacter aestuarii]